MATSTIAAAAAPVVDVAPELLAKWIRSGDVVLIDVREDFENALERIPAAEHCPLTKVDPAELRRQYGEKRIVFHCRSGKRSAQAAQRFRTGDEPVFHLAGGIEAWKSAGMPVERTASRARIDVMRQTQMVIGTIVLAGVLLGALVSPWFLLLSAFMGAGLIFAGASGWCGMAILLAKMPWNRGGAACCVGDRAG